MTLPVVTNSGPLMVFSKLNLLHLLKALYGQVSIPRTVYDETVVAGVNRGFSDGYTLRLFLEQNNWHYEEHVIVTEDISNLNLDRGEKEAIALAISKNALLLMDEEKGREAARSWNILVKGSLGVLIEAYRKNLISESQLRLYFGEIMRRNDIWISRNLCVRLLEQLFGPYP